MTRAISASAVMLALVAGGAVHGQVLYTLTSPNEQPYGWFGFSVSGVDDLDSDGRCDLVVSGRWESEPGGPMGAGRAYVFSGATGAVVHTLISPNEQYEGNFGESVAGSDDVDGDGVPDLLVGAVYEESAGGPNAAGRAYAFSGATGQPIFTFVSPNEDSEGNFGVSVAGAGDVNGDGYADIIVGAPGEDPGAAPDRAGRAYVFSGQDGSVLQSLASPNEEELGHFGNSVSGAGDLDGDGYGDVLVGAYYEDPGASPDSAGRAYLFSGATGALLHTLVSPNEESEGRFGISVSGAGDVNNDGLDDVVVGACGESPGASPDRAGRAYVFSGQDGGLLHTLVSPNEQAVGLFGNAVSSVGDVDGDGIRDLVVGAYAEASGGRAYILSGLTGGPLFTLQSPNEEPAGSFGCAVSGAGDVNGAGYADVIVGACYEDPGASPENAGRAYVFAPADVPIELASFRAEAAPGAVRLAWVTLTETDNIGFNVERAPCPRTGFIALNDRTIPGAGTASESHVYCYVDYSVEPGTTYWYRLEDVSLTGEHAYHGPIQVAVPTAMGLALDVLAGPAPTFVLMFSQSGHASLALHDVSGRLVSVLWEGEASAGDRRFVGAASSRDVRSGVYTATLGQGARTVTRRLVITR
jgi:hypothetical protein